MRRGVIVLTEGRSGSTWLGTLCRSAGLGNSGEWLDKAHLGVSPRRVNFETYYDAIMRKGSSDGHDFYVKIFPRHLFSLKRFYTQDFLQEFLARNKTEIILLSRRDRLLQAISFSRGLQSQQWTSLGQPQRDVVYDFDRICRCYFMIGRSYDFWESWVSMLDLPATRFVYEDLVDDPSPFLNHVADAMGKPHPENAVTDLRIQRDDTTAEWAARFKKDLKERDFLLNLTPSRAPAPNLGNIGRFVARKPMKPLPYSY